MSHRFIVLAGILFLVSMVMIWPVAAATSTGSGAVTGNVKVAVSIALVNSTIFLDLDPALSPVSNTSLGLIVSSNQQPFTITVHDFTGRVAGEQGFMGNYTSGAYGPTANTTLGASLALAGTTNASTSAVAITPPITSTPVNFYTATAKVTNQYLYPNTFTQVVSVSDPVLPSGSVYRIDLQFTISAT